MPQPVAPDRFAGSRTEDGRYRLLVEAVTDYAIYMLDPDGRVTSWNPGAQRFKGYEAAEIIGEHFSRFYTDEDRAAGLPQRALATARDRGQVRERGLAGPQGRHPVLGQRHHRPDPRSRGRAGRLRQDHPRPHRAQSRRGGPAPAARSSSGCWCRASPTTRSTCSDPTGQVASWNAGAQRIKGYTPDEIIGQHFSRFYTEEDRQNGRARARAWRPPRARAGSRRKAGASARTAAGSGPTSIIDAIRDDAGRTDRLRQDHPRHHRAAGGAARPRQGPRGAVPVPEDGGRSASSPAASPTISTIC